MCMRSPTRQRLSGRFVQLHDSYFNLSKQVQNQVKLQELST